MKSIVLSAFADEYADAFEEQLKGLNQFGIDFLEIRHVDKKNVSVLTKSEILEVKSMLDHYGIRVSAVGSPLGKIPLDGNMEEHLETAKRIFDAATVWGADYVRIFSFYPAEGHLITEQKNEVIEALSRLIVAAREFEISLCHENEAKIYGDVPSRCKEILDYFDGELGCVFDMGNFVLEGVNPIDAYETLKDHISYFHIKDALYDGAIVPAGKGEAMIGEILTKHRANANCDFYASLEPHLQTFSGLNALVGRSFQNPYQYPDLQSAFTDAVKQFKGLME